MHDDLDDHPDLAGLRWSKREERRALRKARPPRARSGFLRRHRVKVVAVGALIVLVAAGAVLVGGADHASASVDVEHPFARTPVAQWAEGAAGIAAPPPVALGEYTADEVAAAYASVRELLVTARLNRAVIVRHDVEPYLRLLAPAAQQPIRDAIAKDPTAAYGYTTLISGDFPLLPVQPRVRGQMTAELDEDSALLIHTDYVVAYAFDPAEESIVDPLDIVPVERLATDFLVTDDRWPAAEQGLWPRPVKGYAYSMACTPYDKGVLAPAYSEHRTTDDEDNGDRERMFDPRLPMPTNNGCE